MTRHAIAMRLAVIVALSGALPIVLLAIIGLQIVGKPFEESMILRIAYAYQQLTDWHRREINIQPKI